MNECISREKVLETIRYRVCQGQGNKEHICKRGSCAYCGIMEIMSDISNIEVTDAQPVKHGRWLPAKNWFMSKCSECGYELGTVLAVGYICCPKCTARMDGEQNES